VTFALFAYNQERYIREAVEGAFSQTYAPLEIILSDDCSTDGTFAIMNRMVQEYRGPHRIALNRNVSNLGLTNHVNHVLSLSHGEIIVVAAGDDISFPHRTQSLLKAWRAESPCSAVTSGFVRVDADGRELGTVTSGGTLRFSDKVDLSARLKRRHLHLMFGCTLSFRRDLFDVFGPLVVKFIEDGAIVARAGLREGLVVIGDALVKYRSHPGSVTAEPSRTKALQRFARLRQQTYLQTLVDIGKLQGSTVEVDGPWLSLKARIHWCMVRQDFVVWYLTAPRVARGLLAPALLALCGAEVSKEVLAVSFPTVFRAFSRIRGRREDGSARQDSAG
jgi:glycosyltransferase involved in cell wall biosynthesis